MRTSKLNEYEIRLKEEKALLKEHYSEMEEFL